MPLQLTRQDYISRDELQIRWANLHQVLNDKPAIHSNKHYYTEVEETCMALKENEIYHDILPSTTLSLELTI